MVDRSVRGQGEMTLREFVVLLVRRKFVVLTTALATSLATGASFLIDKSYQASVVVVAVTDPDSSRAAGKLRRAGVSNWKDWRHSTGTIRGSGQ